jgi:hypothetical protein
LREKKQSSAEVDLVIPFRGFMKPEEIKSGSIGKLRSLHQFMDSCSHHYAILLYTGKVEIPTATTTNVKEFKLLNLPYFLGQNLNEYIEWFLEV